MTTAERISEMFGNDGQCFETSDGRSLDDVCDDHASPHDKHVHFDAVRWEFDDGSAISSCGAWDLGYHGCYCWQGGGHSEECPYSAVEPTEAQVEQSGYDEATEMLDDAVAQGTLEDPSDLDNGWRGDNWDEGVINNLGTREAFEVLGHDFLLGPAYNRGAHRAVDEYRTAMLKDALVITD